MGCIESKILKGKSEDCPEFTPEVIKDPELSDVQKNILLSSWSTLKDDITKVGVVTFMR